MAIERFTDAPEMRGGDWSGATNEPAGGFTVHYSGNGRRYGAGIVDWVVPWLFLIWLHLSAGLGGNLILVIWFINSVIIQSATGGQSIGKMIFGIRLVYVSQRYDEVYAYFCYPSFTRLTVRYFCHFLDLIFFWGILLRPFFNVERRSWADSCVKTSVIQDHRVQLWDVNDMHDDRLSKRRAR